MEGKKIRIPEALVCLGCPALFNTQTAPLVVSAGSLPLMSPVKKAAGV